MTNQRSSRLARKETARNLRQAVFFGFLTVFLALSLIFLGIPALIKMAIFLGSLRQTYTPVETQDNLPPSPPLLQPLPEATNSAQITLQGYAEPASTIEIFLNGSFLEKLIALNDGLFITSQISLGQGTNEISAKATDKAGNTSQVSNKLIVVFDNQPPLLIISQPLDQESFPFQQTTITIKGETEPGNLVAVNEHLVIISAEGQFSYPLTLKEGENKIKIVATDQAGNQTENELVVKRE